MSELTESIIRMSNAIEPDAGDWADLHDQAIELESKLAVVEAENAKLIMLAKALLTTTGEKG